MFSDSFVIEYKFKFCDCYTFVCLKYKGEFCDSYTAEIHLLEILRQILWLLHQRFICLKFESCILPFLITKLNFWTKNFVLWIVVGSKKLSGNMWLYSWVIDKYNTMFQNVKRVLHQNKTHTKISQGLQFCRLISYTFIFPAHIFAIIFGKPKNSLISTRIDWFISVWTGLIELLWQRWITWKLKLHFVWACPCKSQISVSR